MIFGALVEALTATHKTRRIGQLQFTIDENLEIDDQDIFGPAVVRINDELMYYLKMTFDTVTRIGTIYQIDRGYYYSSIDNHKIGDLLQYVPEISVKEYDSNNLYGVKMKENGLAVLSSGALQIITGIDVLHQNLRFTLETIGNQILSSDVTMENLSDLETFYMQALSEAAYGVESVTLLKVSFNENEPNKMSILADILVDNSKYTGIEFYLPRRNIG